MTQTYPSARLVLHFAWRSVRRVVHDAPRLALVALGICVLVALCKLAVTSESAGQKTVRVLLDGASFVLLVPFKIAVYRLILLGEQPARYLAYYTERFLPYLKWEMVFWLPAIAVEFTPEARIFGVFGLIGFAIVAIVMSVRLAILFPALAAGRVGVTARDAWRDTQGKIWTVIWVFLIVIIPLMVVMVVIVVWIAGMAMLGGIETTSNSPIWELMLRAVLENAAILVTTIVVMANAALLFDLIGDRVKSGG